MSTEVRVSAPAKINLYLAVGPLRADGFHGLATLYHAVGLYDDVVLRPASRSSMTVSGDGVAIDGVPTDESNLALRAVRALGAHHALDLATAIHVHKRIPVAGGLAGGSADAAAALVGADTLFELRTPRAVLLELAGQLGSDVPFCLNGGTAIGTGRGEIVTPVMTRGEYWWVVVPDDQALATPAVYAELDRLRTAGRAPEPAGPGGAWQDIPDAMLGALRAAHVADLASHLHNDLQVAALSLRPDLAGRLTGLETPPSASLVSGSGPTTVHLCEGPEHAEAVRDHLLTLPGIEVAAVVTGPAHGARVIGSQVGGRP